MGFLLSYGLRLPHEFIKIQGFQFRRGHRSAATAFAAKFIATAVAAAAEY